MAGVWALPLDSQAPSLPNPQAVLTTEDGTLEEPCLGPNCLSASGVSWVARPAACIYHIDRIRNRS